MRSKKMPIAWALILCLGANLAMIHPIAMAQQSSAQSTTVEKVNLNTATAEQLQAIPGIGPAMAKRVLEYRTKVGKFTKIEDILNVKGIGEKTFQKMKDRLTV